MFRKHLPLFNAPGAQFQHDLIGFQVPVNLAGDVTSAIHLTLVDDVKHFIGIVDPSPKQRECDDMPPSGRIGMEEISFRTGTYPVMFDTFRNGMGDDFAVSATVIPHHEVFIVF